MTYECVLSTWHDHSSELTGFLTRRSASREEAADLLQDVFIRAMREGRNYYP